METHEIRKIILDITAESLESQLKAIRRLQAPTPAPEKTHKSRSQLEYVHDILLSAGTELHINEILARIHSQYGIRLDRESVVSALTKKIHRHDRFIRTRRNTFALQEERSC
jgi:hypothetical protein